MMIRVIALALVAAVGGIGALYWSQSHFGEEFVSGTIEADDIRVGSRVGGRISEVSVEEGQRVRTGDPLLTLDPYDLNERLAEARSLLAGQKATLAKLEAGFRSEEIAQARAKRDALKAVLDKLVAGKRPLEISMLEAKERIAAAEFGNANRELERIKAIADRTADELDRATFLRDGKEAALALARDELALAREGTRIEEKAEAAAKLAEAEAALQMLERGYREEEKAEARARVEAAAAAAAALERQLDELTVRAPRECVVDAIDLEPGDLIAPNAPVVTLIDPKSLWVRAYVPEGRLGVQIGQKAAVAVDAYPGRRFAGHIVFIARQSEFAPSNAQTQEERSKRVYRIKVLLDEGHDVLRPGMSADVYLKAMLAQ